MICAGLKCCGTLTGSWWLVIGHPGYPDFVGIPWAVLRNPGAPGFDAPLTRRIRHSAFRTPHFPLRTLLIFLRAHCESPARRLPQRGRRLPRGGVRPFGVRARKELPARIRCFVPPVSRTPTARRATPPAESPRRD